MEKEKKGSDRGYIVKNPLPYAPENIKMSKKDFIAKDNARKEKELKMEEFSRKYDEENKKVNEEVKVNVEGENTFEPEKRKAGRPKRIE